MAKTKDEILDIPEEQKAKYEAFFNEMLEKAKAEAAKIIADAKSQAENRKTKKVNPAAEELVNYTFFKDNGDYADDVFISVNGEKIVCQRGKPVRIKRKFVWAYEQAQRQQERAADMVASNENRYNQRVKELGM